MDNPLLLNLKEKLITHKITVGFILAILALIIGGFMAFNAYSKYQADQTPLEEVDLAFDPEGAYALLLPRRDGNALVLNLKRTASYDAITYELAYVSKPESSPIPVAKKVSSGDGDAASVNNEGIDRGVVGTINTEDKKGEYEQEILFGTCSKNVCKYDTGVENGTLTLHLKKGRQAYRMITQWHLQKPDVSLGVLTSGDSHFTYKISAKREELAQVAYSIINDLTGVPKLPDGKQVFGKVYSLNVPLAKDLMPGAIGLELAENAPADAKLARYDSAKNSWIEMETKVDNGKLTAETSGAGVFAVLVPKK